VHCNIAAPVGVALPRSAQAAARSGRAGACWRGPQARAGACTAAARSVPPPATLQGRLTSISCHASQIEPSSRPLGVL